MNRTHIKLAKTLTILGVLPFVAAVVAKCFGIDVVNVRYLSLTYGAVIASFISGMHWGLFLSHANITRTNLLVTSNVVALLAWSSLLLFSATLQYLLQILCFVGLLLIDRKLTNEGVVERWFFAMRNKVSLLVVICLIALMVMH